MSAQPIEYDPAKPVDVQIKVLSPNVVVWAIWLKPPNGDWPKDPNVPSRTVGDTGVDKVPLGPVAVGTGIFISVGFGGNPNKGYKAETDVLQDATSVGASGTHFYQDILKDQVGYDSWEGVFS